MEESGRKYLTGSIMLSRNEDGSSPEEIGRASCRERV